MSATISALYPPPQSIDSLDQWDSLDSLLWPLDNAVWTTCGVYGLTVSEDAQSADAMDGASIVYGAATGTAASSGACEGEVIHDAGTMLGSASASQSLAGIIFNPCIFPEFFAVFSCGLLDLLVLP